MSRLNPLLARRLISIGRGYWPEFALFVDLRPVVPLVVVVGEDHKRETVSRWLTTELAFGRRWCSTLRIACWLDWRHRFLGSDWQVPRPSRDTEPGTRVR